MSSVLLLIALVPVAILGSSWTNWGGTLTNQRFGVNETTISVSTVQNLRSKWNFNDVSIWQTPLIYDNYVYFTDDFGFVYSLDRSTGAKQWSTDVVLVNASDATATRSLAVSDGLVIAGLNNGYVIALNRTNGQLVWKTDTDPHPANTITENPTIYNNAIYIGTSSKEEQLAMNSHYACCTFRGSMLKLDLNTGAILWQTYLLPDNGGDPTQYAGAAIWGSSPAIDVARNQVYISTGNNYHVPDSVISCQEAQDKKNPPDNPDPCIEADNLAESIVALDLDTGKVNWANQVGGYDVWNEACTLPTPGNNCPERPGTGYDFGQSPMLIQAGGDGSSDILVCGQKNGELWAINPNTGALKWSVQVGPGGEYGGLMWGSATDGFYIYVASSNSENKNHTLANGTVITWGSWAAVDLTGRIVWQVPVPENYYTFSPVMVANGVVYVGSSSEYGSTGFGIGSMYALNAKSGQILWQYPVMGVVNIGPSIVDGTLYWTQGYNTGAAAVYAFQVPTSL